MEMKHPANYFAFYFQRVSRQDCSKFGWRTCEIYTSLLTIMLQSRSRQTWKEMDVWIEILSRAKAREERPRPALAANFKLGSRLCLESFIQIIFKLKIKSALEIFYRIISGPKSNPVSWSSPHQFDYIHPNVGTQWFNFNIKIQSPGARPWPGIVTK